MLLPGVINQQSLIASSGHNTTVAPTFVNGVTRNFTTDTTAHAINMPASVTAGNLLLVFWTNDGTATAAAPSIGTWREIFNAVAAERACCWAKIADGTEVGTQPNIQTSVAEMGTNHTFQFSGWSGDLNLIDGATTSSTSGGTARSCPTLTPDFGQEFAFYVSTIHTSMSQTISAYPANYTNGTFTQGGTGTTGGQLGSCRRASLKAVSETPGNYTLSATNTVDIITAVIAIMGT